MNSGSAMEVHEAGQTAHGLGSRFAIQGMTCVNCARHVTEAIQGVARVESASVDLETRRASVRWAPAAQPFWYG